MGYGTITAMRHPLLGLVALQVGQRLVLLYLHLDRVLNQLKSGGDHLQEGVGKLIREVCMILHLVKRNSYSGL